MAKNALQAQLLKAGLVDSKKAKKISKQSEHAKRTGDVSNVEAKKALAAAQAKKLEKDQKLNQEKQQLLEEKMLKANNTRSKAPICAISKCSSALCRPVRADKSW